MDLFRLILVFIVLGVAVYVYFDLKRYKNREEKKVDELDRKFKEVLTKLQEKMT